MSSNELNQDLNLKSHTLPELSVASLIFENLIGRINEEKWRIKLYSCKLHLKIEIDFFEKL